MIADRDDLAIATLCLTVSNYWLHNMFLQQFFPEKKNFLMPNVAD
jgi:hypothetical protein